MKLILVMISGILFGLGLSVSAMINPTVVLNFLDFLGNWDPALMFVMGGALVVTTIGYPIVFKKKSPLFTAKFSLPEKTDIDKNLVLGASIFGIGWGLVGYCPGPALAGLILLQQETFIFVAAMVVGIKVAQVMTNKSKGS